MEPARVTFRQLDQEAKTIANQYRIHKIHHQLRREKNYTLAPLRLEDSHRFDAESRDDFLSAIDLIIKNLNEPYRRIIRNDYFSDNDQSWWMNYYSRSNYYRVKREALARFLAFFR